MQSKSASIALFSEAQNTRATDTLTNVAGASQHEQTALVWSRVLQILESRFGQGVRDNWLNDLNPAYTRMDEQPGQVVLTATTRFKRDWVSTHYGEAILTIWQQIDNTMMGIELVVAPQNDIAPTSTMLAEGAMLPGNTETASAATSLAAALHPASKKETSARQQHSDALYGAPIDPRLTFDSFIIGKSNELAHAAALSVAESASAKPGSNPLFLCGGVGLGKTHLMHAIAHHIRQHNPARKVVYMSAEQFMYQFISALRSKDIIAFKEHFRSVDVLMIDDIQFISGKDSTQEEFFHTFNTLIDQNKQLVISGDRSPSDLEGMEERIRSRLGWGLVADIHTTTYELRYGILQTKAERSGAHVSEDVLAFLANRITSNVRELEGALNKVIAYANLVKREVTLDSTREILRDLLRANERNITIEDIQRRVADHYNIKLSDMHSARRARNIARPRQVAMYLTKKLTTHSLPEIGRKFGGKDHTTVLHAVRTIEGLSLGQKDLRDDIALLMRSMQG